MTGTGPEQVSFDEKVNQNCKVQSVTQLLSVTFTHNDDELIINEVLLYNTIAKHQGQVIKTSYKKTN